MLERDGEGRPSRWVTETEPEFDANERDDWNAWLEYQEALCPSCGRMRYLCEDPERLWYPQMFTCYATAAAQASSRRWHDKHAKASPDLSGVLPTDGGSIWVSENDLTPDDHFL